MRIKFEVTAEDIAKGKRGRTDCCPLALALNRHFGFSGPDSPNRMSQWVKVRGDEVVSSCSLNGVFDTHHLTREAYRFMCDFDEGRPVSPGTYEVYQW